VIKISEAIQDIISNNDQLLFGFHHQLLNLSQVARFIQPLVEARTQKRVRVSAILMNLSRMHQQWAQHPFHPQQQFYIDKINIHTDLCSFTLVKTSQSHRELNRLYAEVQKRDGFMTITEGISEITTIVESENFALATQWMTEPIRLVNQDIASVGVKFHEKFIEVPGLLYMILQTVTLQHINIVELASTATEFIIYIDQKDIYLAFDAILSKFGKQRQTTANGS
jgi:aspartokinase